MRAIRGRDGPAWALVAAAPVMGLALAFIVIAGRRKSFAQDLAPAASADACPRPDQAPPSEEKFKAALARVRMGGSSGDADAAEDAEAKAKYEIGNEHFARAADYLAQAIEAAPGLADDYSDDALVLGDLKCYPEAIRQMKRYLRLEPEKAHDPALRGKLAQWEAALEDQYAGEPQLIKALEQGETRAQAAALKEQARQARAVKLLAEAGIEWVAIPGGTFKMGGGNYDARPRHRVTIRPFQMAKTLVTNKQYRACVKARACTPPASYFGGDDNPVVAVDWNQAVAFSKWVGGRLPSEAEWEYAARSAGKDYKYPWGNDDATCDNAVIRGCTNGTLPVCSKPAGNTEQGLCDMAGNALEWVEDLWRNSYEGAPTDGSAWVDAGFNRVIRGGSCDFDAAHAGSASRLSIDPGCRNDDLGFRPVR